MLILVFDNICLPCYYFNGDFMNERDTLYIKNNDLIIGSLSAKEIVDKFPTPLYVMDAKYIKDVCNSYVNAMSYYGDGAVAFAQKSFATVATAKLIASCGMWFDAVSSGEIYLLKQANVDLKKVIFHGNAKTRKEINDAVDMGVGLFAIDSYSEIEWLNETAKAAKIKQDVLIRVNPCVAAHTHESIQTAAPNSKFGFTIKSGEALEVIKTIKEKENLNFKGIHLHIGSQIFDHSAFNMAIAIISNFVKELQDEGISIDILDMGGGFGATYTDVDPKFNAQMYGEMLANECEMVSKYFRANGLKKPFLIVEPGRSIVCEAGVTLYTVNAIKDFKGVKKYLAVDGGMFEAPRHALYGADYSAIIANKASEECEDVVTIAGKCCESGDIIATDVRIQKAEIGDILAVFSTGAYHYSMASNYNLNGIPGVVLVDGDKCDYIVKPQTYEDLIRNNTVPSWL